MSKRKPTLSERMAALEERQTTVEQQLDEIVAAVWPEARRFADVHAAVEALFVLLKERWPEQDRGYTVEDLERVRRLFWMKMNTAAENGITNVDWKRILDETFIDVGVDVSNRDFERFFGSRVGD